MRNVFSILTHSYAVTLILVGEAGLFIWRLSYDVLVWATRSFLFQLFDVLSGSGSAL